MRSSEIRSNMRRALLEDRHDQTYLQLEILIEIAAQLAEANELARFELGLDETDHAVSQFDSDPKDDAKNRGL